MSLFPQEGKGGPVFLDFSRKWRSSPPILIVNRAIYLYSGTSSGKIGGAACHAAGSSSEGEGGKKGEHSAALFISAKGGTTLLLYLFGGRY